MAKLHSITKKSPVTRLAVFVFGAVRTGFGTKVIFFIIGITLWLNLNLQKDFETTVNIPIKILNITKGKTLMNPVPKEARIKLRSNGRNLILADFVRDVYFEIDASTVVDSTLVRLNTEYFINMSGKELEPLFIFHPQEIFIQLDEYESKKIPVKLNANYSLAPGYVKSGAFTVDPDSVTVSGPLSIVKNIKEVETRKQYDLNLTRDYSKQIPLVISDSSLVDFSHTAISVHQKISIKGTNTFKAPIVINNKPEDMNILIDPIATEITVTGPVNELHEISSDNFSVSVDAQEINPVTNRIPVEIMTDIDLEWINSVMEVKAIKY